MTRNGLIVIAEMGYGASRTAVF
ncbi:hypothetical protein FRAAL4763 [Frankia alni ACN14a]|uniref:Uncharacterized protein n=1 Tax=Frankia alni (strain DSM 45986 / CECT 9034 / ACN14a) TaxID=326424 RepID=Q0RGI3_FRAAA|nr:hypothetical protein FRAAL4763 [Frankia alni ACN14a]